VLNYGRRPNGQLLPSIERYCVKAPRALPGTMLAIRWPFARQEQHVALCAGATIIHAYQDHAGVVEHGYVGPWVARTVSAWFLPGVDYGE
jgi:hypothetical protein